MNLLIAAWATEHGIGLSALNQLCAILGRPTFISSSLHSKNVGIVSQMRQSLGQKYTKLAIDDLIHKICSSTLDLIIQFKIDGAWANKARMNASMGYSYLVCDGSVIDYSYENHLQHTHTPKTLKNCNF